MLRSGKGWRSAEIRDGLGARRSGKGWACTKIREELGACEDQEWIQGAQRPRKGSEISWGHTRIGAWLEASKEGGWAGDGCVGWGWVRGMMMRECAADGCGDW